MNNSNLIKDNTTRNAIKKLEEVVNRLEAINSISIPTDADDNTRLIIQTLNKITNSFKRKI
jgi:hypothetical protein